MKKEFITGLESKIQKLESLKKLIDLLIELFVEPLVDFNICHYLKTISNT